jgi:hypothetical protein
LLVGRIVLAVARDMLVGFMRDNKTVLTWLYPFTALHNLTWFPSHLTFAELMSSSMKRKYDERRASSLE